MDGKLWNNKFPYRTLICNSIYEVTRSSIASADNTVKKMMEMKKSARRDKAASSSLQLVKAETQETMAQLCSAFLEGEIVELDLETIVKEELEETVVACLGFAFLAQCVRNE